MIQVGREAQFSRLAELVGHPEWMNEPRFATRRGWIEYLESDIRPAIESWARDKSRNQACAWLSKEGIAAGPCQRAEELVGDPHLVARNMLSAIERPDGSEPPVLVPGNPVKLTASQDGPDRRVPWLGEHTDDVLQKELGLTPEQLEELRISGAIA